MNWFRSFENNTNDVFSFFSSSSSEGTVARKKRRRNNWFRFFNGFFPLRGISFPFSLKAKRKRSSDGQPARAGFIKGSKKVHVICVFRAYVLGDRREVFFFCFSDRKEYKSSLSKQKFFRDVESDGCYWAEKSENWFLGHILTVYLYGCLSARQRKRYATGYDILDMPGLQH